MATIDYTADVVAFYRDLFPVEGDYGPAALIPPFLERWLYTCFPLPDGNPAARNVLDSRSKKQGKSSTAAAVALYMAARKRYGEVVIAAADKDQSRDRVLRAVKFAVENHPAWKRAKVYRDVIELDNGSTIMALPMDWRGAAGGNHSCVIFDELHTYTLEYQRRLYDELIIPPSIKAGVRWIASYAGFTGESTLLEEVWTLAKYGLRQDGELPIYHNGSASQLALIDQGEQSWRMPWTTPEYMAEVKASERPNTYRRLWLNEWVSSESQFLPEGAWDACESREVKPLSHTGGRLVFGADASTSRDLTALVGCEWNEDTGTTDVRYVKVWKPVRVAGIRLGKPTIDLSETIGAEIKRLHAAGHVDSVYYDPYQLHSIALDLAKAGIRMIELPQTAQRTEADQSLYDAIISRQLRHYGDPTLAEHVRNAVAIESPRGWRLAKEKTSLKIDACIGLSMAHFGAITTKGQGRYTVIPDPFNDIPRPEGAIWIPILRGADFIWCWPGTEKHQPGVTAANHHFKKHWDGDAYACAACVEELESSGYYRQQAEIALVYKDTLSEDEYNDWRYSIRHPWTPPMSAEDSRGKELFQHIKEQIRRG